jgi:hypothetical protein
MKTLIIFLTLYSSNALSKTMLESYDADKEMQKSIETCIDSTEMNDCMNSSQELISNMELIIEETQIAKSNNEFEDCSLDNQN